MTVIALARPLLLLTALTVAGCWAPPRASVQPKGEPGQLLARIPVRSVRNPVVVQSLDVSARTLTLVSETRPANETYRVAARVRRLARLKAGDRLRVTVLDELSVYIPPAGQPGTDAADGAPARPDARVLSVDPSYRLLVLEYPDGADETLKIDVGVSLSKLASGDAVIIHPREILALSRRRH